MIILINNLNLIIYMSSQTVDLSHCPPLAGRAFFEMAQLVFSFSQSIGDKSLLVLNVLNQKRDPSTSVGIRDSKSWNNGVESMVSQFPLCRAERSGVETSPRDPSTSVGIRGCGSVGIRVWNSQNECESKKGSCFLISLGFISLQESFSLLIIIYFLNQD